MHFETNFVVTGSPEAVALQFSDVPLMASFLPGASVEPPSGDGSFPATLVASFGPKKIAFKGTLKNSVDRENLAGVLVGQASADVRGARMAVTMDYRLTPAEASTGAVGSPAPTKTRVRLNSDAQLTGVLAEFAKAGGIFVVEALITEFARRFSAHVEAAAAGETPAAPTNSGSLSMGIVIGAMFKRLARALFSIFSKPA